MKRFVLTICLLLMFSVLISCSNNTEDKKLLSKMSEDECIEFIIAHDVTIPEQMDKDIIGKFIIDHIEKFEKDPSAPIAISWSVPHDFAEKIRDIVISYYEVVN